jgi:hypothetical protein
MAGISHFKRFHAHNILPIKTQTVNTKYTNVTGTCQNEITHQASQKIIFRAVSTLLLSNFLYNRQIYYFRQISFTI